jgi:uncharacterized membrane protein YfcA
VLGILAGARVGPRLAIRLPTRALLAAFEIVLPVFAVLMVAKALGVGV